MRRPTGPESPSGGMAAPGTRSQAPKVDRQQATDIKEAYKGLHGPATSKQGPGVAGCEMASCPGRGRSLRTRVLLVQSLNPHQGGVSVPVGHPAGPQFSRPSPTLIVQEPQAER